MPTWGELQQEVAELRATHRPGDLIPVDQLRSKYIAKLSERTERATIIYYSGFQQHPEMAGSSLALNPADMTGFMEACSGLTDIRTLDLFLHSPGGSADAVDQICAYLRSQFDHIRAIVPLNAMSAATMVALAADEVLMGAHSQLGPIDPQFTIGMPEGPRTASAQAIKDQFDLGVEQCKDPTKLPAWMPILRSYAPGLLSQCEHAAKRAEQLVIGALEAHMFHGEPDAAQKAADAAAWFGDAEEFLSHGRPVRREAAREHGIKVHDLEDDGELQDAVLSVHHATLITMTNTPVSKLIENDRGNRWVVSMQQLGMPMLLPIGPGGPVLPGPLGPGPGPGPGGPPAPRAI